MILGFLAGERIQDRGLLAIITHTKVSKCKQPPTQREWRSLSSAEKQNYIGAVKRLTSKPSRVLRTEMMAFERM
jgi:hypothetical protein